MILNDPELNSWTKIKFKKIHSNITSISVFFVPIIYSFARDILYMLNLLKHYYLLLMVNHNSGQFLDHKVEARSEIQPDPGVQLSQIEWIFNWSLHKSIVWNHFR